MEVLGGELRPSTDRVLRDRDAAHPIAIMIEPCDVFFNDDELAAEVGELADTQILGILVVAGVEGRRLLGDLHLPARDAAQRTNIRIELLLARRLVITRHDVLLRGALVTAIASAITGSVFVISVLPVWQ